MSKNTKKNSQKSSLSSDVVQLAHTVFVDAVKAELWLRTPIHALNGDTPATRLKIDGGANDVIKLLHKIERGEFP